MRAVCCFGIEVSSGAEGAGGLLGAAGRDSPRRARHFTFASPKESTQRKGDPKSGSLRCAAGNLRCSTPAGVRRTRYVALRSNNCGPDPASICAARPSHTGEERIPLPNAKNTKTNKDTPWRVLVVEFRYLVLGCLPSTPSVCAEERRARRIRDRDCLSRRRVERDPAWPEHRRLPAAQRRDADSRVAFSFAYFSFGECKRKVSSRRATPGQQASAAHTTVGTSQGFDPFVFAQNRYPSPNGRAKR